MIALRPGGVSIPMWLGVVRISTKALTFYRLNVIWSFVSLAVQIILLRAVWEAAYGDRTEMNGVSVNAQIVFLTIALLQGRFLNIQIAWIIQGQVDSGQVAIDMIRPLGFLAQMTARQMGRTLSSLLYILALTPIALLLGSLRPPDPANLMPYALSLLLAYVVGLLTWALVGMLAFWLVQVNAVRATIAMLSTLLAGTTVPLWFMPDWLRVALTFLPFQAFGFLPASIYAGQVQGTALVQPFLVQVAWIVILGVLLRVVWGRARRKLVVQGG